MRINDKGPIRSGSRIAVAGGGPAGCSCALALALHAAERGYELDIFLYEHKQYDTHYNQCLGILSPPLTDLLKEYFDLELPSFMLQREITGYELWTENTYIDLTRDDEEPSYAVRRVEFDNFLIDRVKKAGVDIIRSRITDIEIGEEEVIVYHESGSQSADVIVGACGLDAAMEEIFVKRTNYRPASFLETIVTKIHPERDFLESYDNKIKAFMSSLPRVEFAAITPKQDHLSAIMAGKNITLTDFKKLLASEPLRKALPSDFELTDAYKGFFPNSPAGRFYGDRYVLIGDSAGLIRPFKGKGINSAVITGKLAADTMIEQGIHKNAFRSFAGDCKFLIGDYYYGVLVRYLVKILTRFNGLDPLLDYARDSDEIRHLLLKSVSGSDTYKNIVRTSMKPKNLIGLTTRYIRCFVDTLIE